MDKKWIHIELLGSDPWVLPVRNAINNAVLERRMSEPGKGFGELCSSVSLRLSLLPRIERRIKKALSSLDESLKTREEWHEFTRNKQGHAFRWDHELTLDLVLDVDSLLFEVWSCVELMDTVLKRAYRDSSTPFQKAGKLGLTRKVLEIEGKNLRWIDRIAELRNLFTHQATPYPGVELSSGAWELIILKENVMYLDDDTKFVRLSELRGIVSGFAQNKSAVQDHLINLFGRCGLAAKRDAKDSPVLSPDPPYVITDH